MVIRLTTPRLILRSFVEEDAPRLFTLDHDLRVMRFIGPNALDSVAKYEERIATVYAPYADRSDGLGLWAAMEKQSDEFLGWVCLRPAGDYRFAAEAGFATDEAELGYRFHAAAWNQGFATEASRALIDDVFRSAPISAVVATALEANHASVRVMQKCGLRFVRRFVLPGFETPSVTYALPRSSDSRTTSAAPGVY